MSTLWLITTYFNPLGWRSRRTNYDIFRRHLDARLLTVSWSPDGNHELEDGDADILIRVDGGDLMWQKERLINIGLTHLPDDCDLVGWVDCDILFCDPFWTQRTRDLLADHDVAQLFDTVKYLELEEREEAPAFKPSLISAWQSSENRTIFLSLELERRRRQQLGRLNPLVKEDSSKAPGMAWAARRNWLEDLGGLPDRAIIGGGDLQAAFGLLNILDEYKNILQMHGSATYVSDHSLQWANQAQRKAPRIGHIGGAILHLNHGDRSRRYYANRQKELMRTGFLPDQHLELDAGGAWRFNAAAPVKARQLMASYFRSRREDGTDAVH